jgi:hypothetical protein
MAKLWGIAFPLFVSPELALPVRCAAVKRRFGAFSAG